MNDNGDCAFQSDEVCLDLFDRDWLVAVRLVSAHTHPVCDTEPSSTTSSGRQKKSKPLVPGTIQPGTYPIFVFDAGEPSLKIPKDP